MMHTVTTMSEFLRKNLGRYFLLFVNRRAGKQVVLQRALGVN